MLSKRAAKPHRVKWAEAERALAINWSLPPFPLVDQEAFPIHDEHIPMQPAPVLDPEGVPVEPE